MGFPCHYRRPVVTGAPVQQSSPESSRVSAMENRLEMVEALLQQLSGTAAGSRDSHDDASSFTAPSDDTTLPAVERDSVDGLGTITFSGETISHYFGLSSNSAFAAQISRAVKTIHRPVPAVSTATPNSNLDTSLEGTGRIIEPHSTSNVPPSTAMLSRPASPFRRLQQRKAADLLHLPPSNEMLLLIQAYFSRAGGYFSYVNKASLVHFAQSVQSATMSNISQPFLSLLNAVLACGKSLTLPDSQDIQGDEAQADVYFERAFALSPWVASNTASLETVQGLAVMTQYAEGTSRSAKTWKLHGLLVQAAYNIGLHVEDDTNALHFSPLELEMRRRTWYMCLTLDRMLSSTLGRPPLLQEARVTIPLPCERDFSDKTSPLQQPSAVMAQTTSYCDLFIETIQLHRLLGDLLGELYDQNRSCRQSLGTSDLLTRVMKLDERCHDWQSNLSPSLKLVRPGDHTSPTETPADGARVVLTLRYFSIQLLLYRSILTEYLGHVASGTLPIQTASMDAACQIYVSVCADIAKETIDLIADAQRSGTALPSWWFVLYYLFQSALVIFGTVVFAKSSLARPNLCQFDALAQLQKAAAMVEVVAKNTVIARRCSKYLVAVIQAMQALQLPSSQSESLDFPNDSSGTFAEDFLAFSNMSEFDLHSSLFSGDGNYLFVS
ncbi:hypothetical protein M409DRAFT_16222 [Zasmidium cellare ATCC 36951]|uniref:Xylanolytic transcriptional activator regulatory domain-containing protein n=1 Tax=Zasmidium cellare ATCC 36951 TaxID=1080233 RepID=A0A6A6D6T8_ZASCE|nr:uncharacterized protein M409DRAFT_16222 [Zasmidium cellare ATCC 36951]KAF2173952.1 hypothetical protein M409DRAFT_16222 [Zasmidium cellare ATCC 36951]